MNLQGQGFRTPARFRYSPNCAFKFLNQFRRNALKNQFKKRKNLSKRCTKSIFLKFFNTTLRSAGQKNGELIFEKLCKHKFRIFNSMAVIFYLSFHMLSYFWAIHNLQFHIFRKFKTDFAAKSLHVKQVLNEKIIL